MQFRCVHRFIMPYCKDPGMPPVFSADFFLFSYPIKLFLQICFLFSYPIKFCLCMSVSNNNYCLLNFFLSSNSESEFSERSE